MKHSKYFTCKRTRLLDYLMAKGFTPCGEGRDWNNTRYKVWYFENSDALEEALNAYFANK